MADEEQAASSGGSHVERVVLEVEAPKMGLDAADSGLNIAIRKLGAIDRLTSRIRDNWAAMAREMSRNPFPSRSANPNFMGQQRLFDPPKSSPTPSSASTGGSVGLEVPADRIHAFVVGGKVELLIASNQIQATVVGTGPIAAIPPGGVPPHGTPPGGPSKIPGMGGGAADHGRTLLSATKFKGYTEFLHRYTDDEKRVHIVKTTQDDTPAGSIHPPKAQQIYDKVVYQRTGPVSPDAIQEKKESETTRLAKRTFAINQAMRKQREAEEAEEARAQQEAEAESLRLAKKTLALNEQLRRQREAEESAAAKKDEKLGKLTLRGQRGLQKQEVQRQREGRADARLQSQADYGLHLADQAQRRNMALSAIPAGLDPREVAERQNLIKAAEARSNQVAAEKAMREASARASSTKGPERRQATKDTLNFHDSAISWQTKYVTHMAAAEKANAAFSESTRLIGKNMIDNVKHVTTWAASVGVLYGSLRLARSGLSAMIELEHQQARLGQVFRGNSMESERLANGVLKLASANGRSSSEAMESAISWSRLGLNRVEVLEAVRVSLMAANVAEVSAAEATERLSSVMQVYGLNVSQLNSVLGMLNATSNTWRVTNKDLFDGLSRTASIAKQAGVPLAELIGLIGAGVRATGQTGSNLGNSIKSIIGALSTADKLSTLRNVFHFEGTDGGGGLKNMSELLGELFVAYNRMGDAEKRSMLFSVAGKNQASRMAGLLDNYVRAQILAINAQLNLNSAEAENSKIKAVLKAQLTGLIVEWEKFAKLQGSRTAGPALTELTKSMKGMLAFSNLPIVSELTTLTTVLGAGIAAKLALTAFQMADVGKKGGIMANTFAAIKREGAALGGILNAMALRGSIVTDKLGGKGFFGKAMPAAALPAIGTAAFDALHGTLVDTDKGLMRVKASSGGAAAGLVEFGRGAKMARIGMGAFTDVIVPLLVVYGVIKLINEGMEAIGLTSDKMEGAVSMLDERAQSAGSAAEAANMRNRLMRNSQKVFENPHGTVEQRRELVGQLSEAFAPYQSGDDEKAKSAKDKLRAERTAELIDIANIGDTEKRLAASRAFFNREESDAISQRIRKRAQEREAIAEQIQEIDRQIKKYEKISNAVGLDNKDKIRALQDRRETLTNKRIQSTIGDAEDNSNADELFKQNDFKFKAFAESQTSVVAQLKELYAQIPVDSYLDKLNQEIAAQEYIVQLLGAQLAAKEKQAQAEGGPSTSMAALKDTYRKGTEAEAAIRQQAREEFSKRTGIRKFDSTWLGQLGIEMQGENAAPIDEDFITDDKQFNAFLGPYGEGSRKSMRAARADALKKLAEADKLAVTNDSNKQQITKIEGSDTGRRTILERDEIEKEKEKQDVELAKLNSKRQLEELRDRRSVAIKFSQAQSDAFGTGDPEDRFVNRITGLRGSIKSNERFAKDNQFAIPAPGKSIAERDAETDNARITGLQQRVELSKLLIDGELRMIELGKEEVNVLAQKNREYQRQLLTLAPSELLRRLAVNQLTKDKKISAGQFFALDQGARKDFLDRPENTEEIRQLRRERSALEAGGFGRPNALRERQREAAQAGADRQALFANGAPPDTFNIGDNFKAALQAASDKINVGLIPALDRFQTKLDSMFFGNDLASGAEPAPFLPQGANA